MRKYNKEILISNNQDILSLNEFEIMQQNGVINQKQGGIGFWCKNGLASNKSVFIYEKEDADSVLWDNKNSVE